MKLQTFERALHAWDEWHKSIEQSRKLLGYNPKWPKGVCTRWIKKHYYPEIRKQAEAELKRLELPPNLFPYWENCFYNDYRTPDGITDFKKITCGLSTKSNKRKSFPDLPCDQFLSWNENEDIHDPWLRVEIKIHTRFATKELFEHAAKLAYFSIQYQLLLEKIEPHPICDWLKGGRPSADKSLALECVHLKDNLKNTYKEIGANFGWPLQRDSYNNLNQCSTARRYVKWGRELRKKNQQ